MKKFFCALFALSFIALSATEITNPTNNKCSPRETCVRLLDGKVKTKWCVNFNGKAVLVLKFQTPQKYSSYTLTSANDDWRRDPKNWTVEGSKDGKNWVLLGEVKNNPRFEKRFQARQFTLGKQLDCQFYRFTFTATHNGKMLQLSEIKFAK